MAGWQAGLRGAAARLRVELQRSAPPSAQAPVERLEEEEEPLAWVVPVAVGVAQPLDGRDGDGPVKDALSEGHPQPHVLVHQVSLDPTLLRDVEHVAADVDADPLVAVLFERLATQPGAAPNVEDHARPALRQAQHLHSALSHLRLHVDHARRVQVLARLRRVIEHLGRRHLLGPRHCGGPLRRRIAGAARTACALGRQRRVGTSQDKLGPGHVAASTPLHCD